MKLKKENFGLIIILTSGIIAFIVLLFSKPIVQNELYHNFCDADTIFGISNFNNVISNVPFIVVGVWGFFKLYLIHQFKIHYVILLIGVILIGIGSGYYHLNPNNTTLVWDRLPMTIVFMALLSIIIGEFINMVLGRTMLLPSLLIGIASVFYWIFTEDLKFYAFVQFYPMLIILITLLLFKPKNITKTGCWLLLLMYIIAKLCEYFDNSILEFLNISGHTLKHLFSALGLFLFIKNYLSIRIS